MSGQSPLRFLLFGLLCGVLAGCGPKSSLQGWLSRSGGEWQIKAAVIFEIKYSSEQDSTVRGPESITGGNLFRFYKDETGDYGFTALGSRWTGEFSLTDEGEYLQGTVNTFAPAFNMPTVSFTIFDVDRQTAHMNFRYADQYPNGNPYAVTASIDLKRLED